MTALWRTHRITYLIDWRQNTCNCHYFEWQLQDFCSPPMISPSLHSSERYLTLIICNPITSNNSDKRLLMVFTNTRLSIVLHSIQWRRYFVIMLCKLTVVPVLLQQVTDLFQFTVVLHIILTTAHMQTSANGHMLTY